jgi:lipid-binding SYLF domain-containing protein
MKKYFVLLLPFLFLLPVTSNAVDEYSVTADSFKTAKNMRALFKSAYGYALFPNIAKGGFIFGGAHGDGKVYRKGKVTGKTSMTQITVGLLAGGQAYSQVIFFQNKLAYDKFTSEEFEFGAQATAVALKASAQASSGTSGTSIGSSSDGKAGSKSKSIYYNGMAIFTLAKGGFMFEASLGGQKYSFKPLR